MVDINLKDTVGAEEVSIGVEDLVGHRVVVANEVVIGWNEHRRETEVLVGGRVDNRERLGSRFARSKHVEACCPANHDASDVAGSTGCRDEIINQWVSVAQFGNEF